MAAALSVVARAKRVLPLFGNAVADPKWGGVTASTTRIWGTWLARARVAAPGAANVPGNSRATGAGVEI